MTIDDWRPWDIAWTPRAEHDLRRLDREVAQRVRHALHRYADTGRGSVVRLAGKDGEYRLRVGDDWRVRFSSDWPTRRLIVLRVLPRARAYRR